MRVSHVVYRVSLAVRRGLGSPSREAERRLLLLRAATALARKSSVSAACAELGLSRATFYRWAARVERGHVEALEPYPRRPRRPREAPARRLIRERIEQLRKDSSDGKEKLVVLLAREGVTASASTIGRCLRELFNRGVIDRYVPAGRPRNWRPRPPRPYAIRTPKGIRSTSPGEVVQVDTLFIEWQRVSWRQFSAIDTRSRYSLASLGEHARASDAERFLVKLVTTSPFPVRAIQVDQGSEFKDVFELTCQELGITLYENHARTPKQNAFVERLQRTFRDEFYRRTLLSEDVTEANEQLQKYIHRYNHTRPHASLNYQTPSEYLANTGTPLLSQKT